MNNEISKIWTVSELNQLVKDFIESNFAYPFWLKGEISGLTIHNSGHVYFTLKDKNSQIKATFFRGATETKKLGLTQGSMIEAFGKITVYYVRGEYQFNISKIRLKGLGDLHIKFEELKEKLRKEGLFDEARKKKIPLLPLKIGVVTSPHGAAIRDFLKVIMERFPNLHIRIFPAAIQGVGAEKQIAEGIKFFNQNKFPDVIIITRGGGSIEDLWPFNEELLARTIADSTIPVISAVGHEIDFTIADFVADLRAPTPTAAADLVIAKENEFISTINDFKRIAKNSLQLKLEKSKNILSEIKASRIFADPTSIIRDKQQLLDELKTQMQTAIKDTLNNKLNSVQLLTAKIAMLSPYKVLERGYSILQKKDSSIVDDYNKTRTDDELLAILANGKLKLQVKGRID